MFKALQPLLAACASITTIMVANQDGTITVSVIPKSKKDGEAHASLNTPLALTGTPEELNADFAGMLTSYTSKLASLAEQLESTEAVLDAAKKLAATKATKAIKKSSDKSSPAQGGTEPGGDDDDDDQDKKDTGTGGQQTNAVAPAVSTPPAEENLFTGE